MNFKFAKTLMMGSVVAMGAFGLVACGDDSSSSPSNDKKPTEETNQGELSTDIDITLSTSYLDYTTIGDLARFSGQIKVDASKDTVNFNNNITITAIEYDVAKGTVPEGATSYTSVPNVEVMHNELVPGTMVDIGSTSSLSVKINMAEDPAMVAAGCGDYTLVIKVTTTDDNGKNTVSPVLIPFTRDADEFCFEAPVDDPNDKPAEIAMEPCQVIFNTENLAGLDLATCTAIPSASAATADIIIKATGNARDPEFAFTSGNGTTFAPITNSSGNNYCDDYEAGSDESAFWPELAYTIGFPEEKCPGISTKNQAYVSDFLYNTNNGITGETIENASAASNQIYVAKTPAYDETTKKGFYAFGIVAVDKVNFNNGDVGVTLKVYRVQ